MAAEGYKEVLCDLSSVVAFDHNEQWLPKVAKVATKLAKISANGNVVSEFTSLRWLALNLNNLSNCYDLWP